MFERNTRKSIKIVVTQPPVPIAYRSGGRKARRDVQADEMVHIQ